MRFVFDIDDTILYTEIKNGEYILKSRNEELIKIINKLYMQGDVIILHTGRHWNHLENTIRQLRGVNRTALVLGKPPADKYIDDKAETPERFIDEYRQSL